MAGLPPSSMGQPCMYNDPSVYVKTEYDQGKPNNSNNKSTGFSIYLALFEHNHSFFVHLTELDLESLDLSGFLSKIWSLSKFFWPFHGPFNASHAETFRSLWNLWLEVYYFIY